MRWSWLVVVVCLGWSSFGTAKGKVDPKDVPGTVKWLCSNYEQAFVDARLAKCSAKERGAEPAKSFAKLAANNYHQCLEVVNSGLGQKRLKFTGARAQKCIAAQKLYVQQPSKESREAMLTTCSEAVVGLKGKDDACESPLDCEAGFVCNGVKGSAPGKCHKASSEGDNCDTDLLSGSAYIGLLQEAHPVCSAGLVCSEEVGKPRICSEHAKVTGPVFAQPAGAACKDSGECKGLCQSGICKAVCGSG